LRQRAIGRSRQKYIKAEYRTAADHPARTRMIDGVLGDGTMLKRGDLPVLASPRLVSAPGR
jgi:hypothetical protein